MIDLRPSVEGFLVEPGRGELEMRLYSLLDTAACEYGPVMQF